MWLDTITLEPAVKPVYIPAYRIPHNRHQILEKSAGYAAAWVIQLSTSPWSVLMLLFPKPNIMGFILRFLASELGDPSVAFSHS